MSNVDPSVFIVLSSALIFLVSLFLFRQSRFLDKDGREALVAYLKDQGVKNPIPKQSSMNDGDFVVAIQPNDQRTFLNAVKGQSVQAGVSRESRTVLAKQPR